jgi:hypothetical protein
MSGQRVHLVCGIPSTASFARDSLMWGTLHRGLLLYEILLQSPAVSLKNSAGAGSSSSIAQLNQTEANRALIALRNQCWKRLLTRVLMSQAHLDQLTSSIQIHRGRYVYGTQCEESSRKFQRCNKESSRKPRIMHTRHAYHVGRYAKKATTRRSAAVSATH